MIFNGTRLAILVISAVAAAAAGPVRSAAASGPRGDFSHGSRTHRQMKCGSCHRIPTPNWVSARGFPDVADYPGHDSCIGCHQNDFFRGNRPEICAICHTNVGPRGSGRFGFPSQTPEREFEIIFPHDAHQNIIARNDRTDGLSVVHFVSAGFRRDDDDEKASRFNNCAICHANAERLPEFVSTEPRSGAALAAAAAENFAPKPAFFKGMPRDHSSCFNCHYRGQEPVRTNCAGCHRLTPRYIASDVVKRYSVKYDHSSENHANKDCTVCHIRITQTSDLRDMAGADVPLLTCSSSACHVKELRIEIGKREKSIADGAPVFQCVYCHATAIGRFRIPAGHLEQAK